MPFQTVTKPSDREKKVEIRGIEVELIRICKTRIICLLNDKTLNVWAA